MDGFGAAVTRVAVGAVRRRLDGAAAAAGELLDPGDPPALRESGASFVTLEREGRLRGCIGSLRARRPLYADVAGNAVRAMTDPRLPAVTAGEWPGLTVKVSVLSPPEPVPASSYEGLTAALRPGVDGLILSRGPRRATFLPSVWARLREPRDFVAALLRKGGWDGWPAGGLAAERYTSTEYVSAPPEGGRP